ncbi:hypothetical protein PIB30_056868 [Stylosanthes scabra]|uniref:Uncharacterized protein n=1 Tax=Stylosanthes scabra TaxID=79078 RepID=A0ABU6UJY5_9FABA|nr:hypothetical protein [Stylosanthes scabra]
MGWRQDLGGQVAYGRDEMAGSKAIGIETNEGTRMPSNRRASSPSFRSYVNQSVYAPPPVVPAFEDDVQPGLMESPDGDVYQPEGVNSDSGEDEEFIPETQPPIVDPAGIPTTASPLNRVPALAGHYSAINPDGTHSEFAEDGPSNYPVSGELELEIELKFGDRETAMLAVKNYNIRRSAEFNVVESDRAIF